MPEPSAPLSLSVTSPRAQIRNQGLAVSSSGVRWKGFTFATESERQIAMALSAAGILFAPLPILCVADGFGRRMHQEVDFLIVHRGVPAVLHLDGKFHEGRAASDHERDYWLQRAGLFCIHRAHSVDARRDPLAVVKRMEALIGAYRSAA